jgi:predicted nucleic acid-binding Zn ribbon protein
MSARITGTLHPWGPISQADRVRSYQSGRVCTHADCGTILSIYNPSRFCTVHAGLAAGGRRRGAARPRREIACEQCGTVFETGNQARKFCSDRCRMAAFARRKRARLRAESRLLKAQSLHQAVAPAPDGREPVGSAA